jgi:hypothetical protein
MEGFIIIMYTLVTFTPVELNAITHYLSSVVPRSTLEQDELFELLQRLKKVQVKLNEIARTKIS